jgi:hypothetical protein
VVQRMQGRPFLTASTMCAVIFSHFSTCLCHLPCVLPRSLHWFQRRKSPLVITLAMHPEDGVRGRWKREASNSEDQTEDYSKLRWRGCVDRRCCQQVSFPAWRRYVRDATRHACCWAPRAVVAAAIEPSAELRRATGARAGGADGWTAELSGPPEAKSPLRAVRLVGDGRGEGLVGVNDAGDDGTRLDIPGVLRDMGMIARGHQRFVRVKYSSRFTIDDDLDFAAEDVTAFDAVMQVMSSGPLRR